MLPLNYQDLYEIDSTPDASTATYLRLAAGLSGAVLAANDVVDQTTYLDGGGFGSSDVTGGQKTIAITGHRDTADAAQNYVAGLSKSFGDARKTSLRYRDSRGVGFDAEVTIANIETGGGDAASKKDITFEIHANGEPTEVALTNAPALSITISAGTTSGTTKCAATAGTGNTLSYKLLSADYATQYVNQYLSGDIAYTSTNEITAVVGQFLAVFEIDANGRIVTCNSEVLASGDIAS